MRSLSLGFGPFRRAAPGHPVKTGRRPRPGRGTARSWLVTRLVQFRRIIVAFALLVTAMGLSGTGYVLWQSGHLERIWDDMDRRFDRLIAASGLTVQTVTVSGRKRVGADEVLRALRVARGTSMFGIDVAAAQHRIASLEWVRTAAVTRLWPDRIHVTLDEREPFALWQRDGSITLIDRSGTPITEERIDAFARLPLVVGPGAAARASELIDMLKLEPLLFRHFRSAVYVSGRRWSVWLDNGIEVRLPADDATFAWRRLAELERAHGLLERDIEVVDLRLDDRTIVRITDEARERLRRRGKET